MRAKLHLVLSISIFFISFYSWSQADYWKPIVSQTATTIAGKNNSSEFYQLEESKFRTLIGKAKLGKAFVYLPVKNKGLVPFKVRETGILHPDLAKKYPEIQSFTAESLDKLYRAKISVTPLAVDATVLDVTGGEVQILAKDKAQDTLYHVHDRNTESRQIQNFICKTPYEFGKALVTSNWSKNLVQDQTLRKFRIAVSATGEYTAKFGGTKAGALAAINATLTRINMVFERDLAITLELISNNDAIIYTDKDTDPYGSSLNSEVQSTINAVIGAANYDVGHLFHVANDNGNAGSIGSVCKDASKGSAFSAAQEPSGDAFDLDYVAHELGHQFGANHTWSFETEGTGVQMEPASGTTIMGYAGIVEGNNVAESGSDYFHHASIAQITDFIATTSCAEEVVLANQAPVIASQTDYIIPKGTAFALTASATDADGDMLTYAWEQIDNGVVTTETFGPENSSGANFRSVPPTASPTRYFPRLSRVARNLLTQTLPTKDSIWETVSTVERNLKFAVTVRDNNPNGGQIAADTVAVSVVNGAGPFKVTSQMLQETYQAGSVQTISWDVANTNVAPINAEEVAIYFSDNGGLSYDHLLVSGVPNTGTAKVQMPGVNTTNGRVMVKGVNTIFFAVNKAPITVTSTDVVLNFDALNYEVCKPNSLVIPFVYEAYNGFAETATLSINGPAGVTAVFSEPTVTANNTPVTVTLDNLASVPAGYHNVEIVATANSITTSVVVTVLVLDDAFTGISPVFPADEAAGITLSPTLEWTGTANHQSYDVEVATDAMFTNIISLGTVNFNSYKLTSLLPETTYFWRIKPKNECGEGVFGAVHQFTTSIVDCDTFDADFLPLEIPSENAVTVSSKIAFFQDVKVADLKVAVELSHTFLEDLTLRLISPNGTSVVLVSKACGSSNNIVAVFEDGGDPVSCGNNPAISGNLQPFGSLASFNGESLLGEWTLQIEDAAASDGGELVAFSLEVCVEGIFRPDEDGDGVFDDGDDLCLGTPKGTPVNTSGCAINQFAANNFTVAIASETCINAEDGMVSVTAADTTLNYTATITGGANNLIQDFTEEVSFEGLSSGTYQLCIVGTNGTVNYTEKCFEVVVTEPELLEVLTSELQQGTLLELQLSGANFYTIELNGVLYQTDNSIYQLPLVNGKNDIKVSTLQECQGVYKETVFVATTTNVVPNPVRSQAQVWVGFPAKQVSLQLFAMDGTLLWVRNKTLENRFATLEMDGLANGVYLLKIVGNGNSKTVKVVKR
ncbi:reprolysin-like metallopeptidase [Flavobacterium sp. ASW18X]|uniref:reprolysin-like metallopeptidase n=1 Tax=Flavobacterium sp. ASW18X TaxID=2572595 RepID=UPI0010ADB1EE|nr:zinc-dependent metalloprotease family protein [Flavobacterium sp. ASW18X]TKD66498.1 T9SS type A sorting domain-containing protein [Flavobacterium sp. ASW18X]